jgi:hypothetical protein
VKAPPCGARRLSLVVAVRAEDPHLQVRRLHLPSAGSRPMCVDSSAGPALDVSDNSDRERNRAAGSASLHFSPKGIGVVRAAR